MLNVNTYFFSQNIKIIYASHLHFQPMGTGDFSKLLVARRESPKRLISGFYPYYWGKWWGHYEWPFFSFMSAVGCVFVRIDVRDSRTLFTT